MGSIKTILSLFTLAMLFSCNSVKEGQYASVAAPNRGSQIQLNSVGFAAEYLKNKILCTRTTWVKTPTNTVEAIAVLKNRTDYPQMIEAQTIFMDANGVPIGEPTHWEKIYLSEQAFSTYRALSTDTNVGAYYIQVREGK